MIRSQSGGLADALASLSLPDGALVFAANSGVSDEWPAVLDELTEAFDLSQAAVRSGGPIVFVVDGDDLLGRGGIGGARWGRTAVSVALCSRDGRPGPRQCCCCGRRHKSESVRHGWRRCADQRSNGELIRLGVIISEKRSMSGRIDGAAVVTRCRGNRSCNLPPPRGLRGNDLAWTRPIASVKPCRPRVQRRGGDRSAC